MDDWKKSRSELINYILEGGDDSEKALSFVKTELDKLIYNHNYHTHFDTKDFHLVEEFEKILNKYVPSSGKSNTVIGEIIRGYNKLMYRYLNDGDDIECGPYSGIIVGLKYNLDCPFVPEDNCAMWSYDWEVFNNSLSCAYGRDVVKNLAFNCLILETFDYYNRRASLDISEYYDYITNFIVDERILKKFEDYGINLKHNFGSYGSNFSNSVEHINSIAEDLYIYFNCNTIKFEYMANMNAKFKLEFDFKEADAILEKYGELLKFIVYKSTIDYKKYLPIDKLKEELNKMGFTINNEKYIQKMENAEVVA